MSSGANNINTKDMTHITCIYANNLSVDHHESHVGFANYGEHGKSTGSTDTHQISCQHGQSDTHANLITCLDFHDYGLVNSVDSDMAIGSLEGSLRASGTFHSKDTPQDGSSSRSIWNSSRRQKLILACLAISNIVNFMPQSIIAPFFPKEVKVIII